MLSHPLCDHVGGCLGIVTQFAVGEIFDSGQAYDGRAYVDCVRAAAQRHVLIRVVRRGLRWATDDGVALDILAPTDLPLVDTGDDIKENSVVARQTCMHDTALFMGDAEIARGSELIEHPIDLRADSRILKVGHHGSGSPELWEYVNRFTAFHRYEAALRSLVDGRLEAWPVTRSYLQRALGDNWTLAPTENIANFEDACLAMMPLVVYEKFVRGYTEKQWGVPANTLSKELAGRFDVREDDEPRLSRHRYQGIPANGYDAFVRTMLDGIPVELSHVYSVSASRFAARKRLIFTGPIDEFFGFTLGRLAYRGQRRETAYLDSIEHFQPCGQVNNPDPAVGHIRTLEWKHMMAPGDLTGVRGTVITRETPYSPRHTADYEYPFPDARNRALYQSYRRLADSRPD